MKMALNSRSVRTLGIKIAAIISGKKKKQTNKQELGAENKKTF